MQNDKNLQTTKNSKIAKFFVNFVRFVVCTWNSCPKSFRSCKLWAAFRTPLALNC
jgi:hypothetical protein